MKKMPRCQNFPILLPVAALLSGCLATTGPVSPMAGNPAKVERAAGAPRLEGIPAVPERFTVGGNLPLQKTTGLTNPVFRVLPPVTSGKDYEALLKLATTLAAEAKAHADAGRTQEFIETWYVAQLFLAYAQQIKVTTELFVDSLRDDGSGKLIGRMPARTTAIIPIDRAIGDIEVGVSPKPAMPASSASQGRKPLTINNLIASAMGLDTPAPAHPGAGARHDLPSLNELPEGVPVKTPNGVELYRSEDNLIVTNPNPNPADVRLSDAGWTIPAGIAIGATNRGKSAPPQDEAVSRETARLKITMSRQLTSWFWDKLNANSGISTIECRILPPGIARCTDGDQQAFDLSGRFTQEREAAAAAQYSYMKEPKGAFRVAVDFLKNDTPPYVRFKQDCSPHEFSKTLSYPVYAVIDDTIVGSRAELQSLRCWIAPRMNGQNGAFRLVHSQQFHLRDGQYPMTEAALLKNSVLSERLKKAAELNKVAQDAVALLPVLSNIENAAKCAGGPEWSPTVFLIQTYQSQTLQQEALDRLAAQAFMPLEKPLSQRPDAVSTTASCIGALTPGAWGKIAKVPLEKIKTAYLAASGALADPSKEGSSKALAVAGHAYRGYLAITAYRSAIRYATGERPINPQEIPFSKLDRYY